MATSNIEELSVGFTGDLTGLRGALAQAVDSIRGGAGEMVGALSGVTKAGGLLTGMFAGLAAVVGSGALFKMAINEAVSLGTEVGNLSRRFQVTTGEASSLAVAIGDAFLSTSEFLAAANGLTRQLRTNEEGLKGMGLATRESSGQLRSQKELMFDGLKVLREYRQGTDQLAAAQVIFGRGVTEEVLTKLFDVQDNLKKSEEDARKYGLMLGVVQVQAARDFKIAQDNVNDAVRGTAVTIGSALLPTVTSLLNIMSEGGASALPTFRLGAQLLSTSLAGLTSIVYDAWQMLKGFFFTITTGLLGFDQFLSKIVSGDWAGAKEAWRSTTGAMGEIWDEVATNITNRTSQLAKDMEKIWSDPSASAGKKFSQGENREGNKAFVDPKVAERQANEMLARFRKDLEMLKAVQGDYYSLAKEEEVAFWQEKLNIFAKGSDQQREVYLMYLRARRELAQEGMQNEKAALDLELGDTAVALEKKIRLAEQWAQQMRTLYGSDSKEYRAALLAKTDLERAYVEQQKQMADIRRNTVLQANLTELELTREMLAFQVELGAISAEERLQIEARLIQRRFDLLRQDLLARREQANTDVLERERINAELIRLEQQLGLELGRLRIDQQRVVLGSWQQMFDGLFNTMEGVLQGLLTRTITWRQAMQQIVGSLLQSFIKLGVDKVKAWVMSEVLMTDATKLGNVLRTAAQAAGSATTVATKATEATAVVGANAAEAATGAAASQAAIPVIGPALAVAAAAAIFAFVMGFGGGGKSGAPTVPSAARGWWDIPQDTLAMVHQREMIMPGELADGVRDLVENGGSGGGNQVYISAVDAQSVRRLFEQHGDSMFDALKGKLQRHPRSRS